MIDTSGAPASIEIVGGDLGCSGGPCNIDFTIVAVASGLVSFEWGYETTDDVRRGDPVSRCVVTVRLIKKSARGSL
jgi:hypothetical protein